MAVYLATCLSYASYLQIDIDWSLPGRVIIKLLATTSCRLLQIALLARRAEAIRFPGEQSNRMGDQ